MKPLFKIGQKVTIKNRGKDSPADYPFSYVNGMVEYSGRKMTVGSILLNKVQPRRKYSDYHDGCQYFLLEDSGSYMWSSSMFKETYEL